MTSRRGSRTSSLTPPSSRFSTESKSTWDFYPLRFRAWLTADDSFLSFRTTQWSMEFQSFINLSTPTDPDASVSATTNFLKCMKASYSIASAVSKRIIIKHWFIQSRTCSPPLRPSFTSQPPQSCSTRKTSSPSSTICSNSVGPSVHASYRIEESPRKNFGNRTLSPKPRSSPSWTASLRCRRFGPPFNTFNLDVVRMICDNGDSPKLFSQNCEIILRLAVTPYLIINNILRTLFWLIICNWFSNVITSCLCKSMSSIFYNFEFENWLRRSTKSKERTSKNAKNVSQ